MWVHGGGRSWSDLETQAMLLPDWHTDRPDTRLLRATMTSCSRIQQMHDQTLVRRCALATCASIELGGRCRR